MPVRPRSAAGGALVWLLLLILLGGGAAFYFELYPERLPEWATRTDAGRDLQTTTVYRWRDAAGEWQVSDRPPPAGVEYEVDTYARKTNVLPLPPKLER